MQKYFIFFLLPCLYFSCKPKDFNTFLNQNSIEQNSKKYIKVNYTHKQAYYENSISQFVIENDSDRNMYIFSTVFENPTMFYSKSNMKEVNDTIFFDSFYKDYMDDSVYSGVRKFTFNKILPHQNLKIFIDKKYFSKNLKLKYYYFFNNTENSLIEVNNLNLMSNIINATRD